MVSAKSAFINRRNEAINRILEYLSFIFSLIVKLLFIFQIYCLIASKALS
jgi:hypothetical protein